MHAWGSVEIRFVDQAAPDPADTPACPTFVATDPITEPLPRIPPDSALGNLDSASLIADMAAELPGLIDTPSDDPPPTGRHARP